LNNSQRGLAAAAAHRDAVVRGATGGADPSWSSFIKISSSLPCAAFFGGGFALPDPLRAVVLDAAVAAALDPTGYFSKKSVIEGCADAIGFAFLGSWQA
jgi:hypothetical protein